jgi:hypothetical protein
MAVVRAYLLSNLLAQRAGLADEFPNRFPHAWLVWEPGVWKPSPKSPMSAVTQIGVKEQGATPVAATSDPLCFELRERAPFKVGRAPDCDIRINEGTVSRDHLWLEPLDGGGWMVRPGSPSSVTLIGGQSLGTDGYTLSARETMELGTVVVTFETAASLLQRLDELRQRR